MREPSLKKGKKRFFITGGGTGGHIYPAVAVAKSLKDDDCGHEIFYVGNPKNIEKEIAEKEGFKFLSINISGMPRKVKLGSVLWGWKLAVATLKSVFYILKYRPNVVFGTGGYVSAPALFAAILTNTPFAIHDCDSEPGIVSKTVAPFAKFVSVAFESAQKFLKSQKILLNGNPIRGDFLRYDRKTARKKLGLQDKLTILVAGGSQGAKTINSALVNSLGEIFSTFDVQIIHQSGKKNYDDVIAELEEVWPDYKTNKNYILRPYFDEMFLALPASDIAVSRAGSLSISEICASGAASVLVPFPYAAADHQRKNARDMERRKASIYLEDSQCNSINLFEHLKYLIENPEELKQLQASAKTCARPHATDVIHSKLLEIA
jgi:UDP-N-acetylglucosamine--N-acetylmuramyl-(pentapeptide) pyrophosphoryl-undecaprenol N-acetylglucosamine transferase